MTKSLLIVVDVQKFFINEFTKEIPIKIKEYLTKNRDKYDFIVFTKFINKLDSQFAKWLNWKECMKPEDTEIVDELKQFIDEKSLFKKGTYSIFKSKELLDFIRKNKITKIFLCGLNTDACILASAFEGFDWGFEVHILKELTRTYWGPKEFNEQIIKLLGYKIDPKLLEE